MKKQLFTFVTLLFVLLLAACSGDDNNQKSAGTEDMDVKEMVEYYSGNRDVEESASITSDQLIITKENEEKVYYDLPKDEFFVSIAPYTEVTHPCAVHSLTGCQGEMVNEEFDVYIEDSEGNVIIDEKLSTLDNGFIDLWLPKGETFHISIEHEKGSAEGEFSTFSGDNTCNTVLQLQ